jgi:hypothetical protein
MAETRGHLVNIAQACTIAGISRRTLYNWMGAGKVPYCRTVGGAIRIDPASLFLPADAPSPRAMPVATARRIAQAARRTAGGALRQVARG